jgi:hypothetical protein
MGSRVLCKRLKERRMSKAAGTSLVRRVAAIVVASTGAAMLLMPSTAAAAPTIYEHHEAQPSLKDLVAFARGNGIPYPTERRERFGAAMAAWKADRRARGLPVPERLPPRKARAEARARYSRDVGAAREGERPLKRWDDAEECVAWVARYLEGLPASARSTRRSYRDWALRQDGAPSPSALAQHGGFERIRRLAQEHTRAARRPPRA